MNIKEIGESQHRHIIEAKGSLRDEQWMSVGLRHDYTYAIWYSIDAILNINSERHQ